MQTCILTLSLETADIFEEERELARQRDELAEKARKEQVPLLSLCVLCACVCVVCVYVCVFALILKFGYPGTSVCVCVCVCVCASVHA